MYNTTSAIEFVLIIISLSQWSEVYAVKQPHFSLFSVGTLPPNSAPDKPPNECIG
jgi:hypothetical protein